MNVIGIGFGLLIALAILAVANVVLDESSTRAPASPTPIEYVEESYTMEDGTQCTIIKMVPERRSHFVGVTCNYRKE